MGLTHRDSHRYDICACLTTCHSAQCLVYDARAVLRQITGLVCQSFLSGLGAQFISCEFDSWTDLSLSRLTASYDSPFFVSRHSDLLPRTLASSPWLSKPSIVGLLGSLTGSWGPSSNHLLDKEWQGTLLTVHGISLVGLAKRT